MSGVDRDLPLKLLRPLDCDGERIEVGDYLESTRDYGERGIVARVTTVYQYNLIGIRYEPPRAPEVWRSAAFLWKKISKPEVC